MKSLLFLLLFACLRVAAQTAAPSSEAGWITLFNGRDITGWHMKEQKADRWFTAGGVRWNPEATPIRLEPFGPPGGVVVNGATGRSADLISDAKFADAELHVEFLIPRKSNSGVYLHGLYEVQILDSHGATERGVHDCGAIYQRWIDGKGVGGRAPLRNVCDPPGKWQSFDIWFRAPRFARDGRKTENARFLKVLHNGVLIHNQVEVEGPTRASLEIPEAVTNPIMLQGDHGPVAFRNIRIRLLAKQ
jgi:hypothetical protein